MSVKNEPEQAREMREAVEQALSWAYIKGAEDVHRYWTDNPGEAPRGDPEFGEAASDYAKAALDPYSSAARVPDAIIAALADRADGALIPADIKPGENAVERAARAIHETRHPVGDWDNTNEASRKVYRDYARAALADREAGGWRDIASAPSVKGNYFFCRLTWGPADAQCTGDGFRWNDRWFAAAMFHAPTAGADGCQNSFRQIEVQPTHWQFLPAAPNPPQAGE